jgi:hypothetical protein
VPEKGAIHPPGSLASETYFKSGCGRGGAGLQAKMVEAFFEMHGYEQPFLSSRPSLKLVIDLEFLDHQ